MYIKLGLSIGQFNLALLPVQYYPPQKGSRFLNCNPSWALHAEAKALQLA